MTPDPAAYIAFSAILGASIGFFGCGIFASNKIRRANIEGYKEAVRHYQDEAARRRREAEARSTSPRP